MSRRKKKPTEPTIWDGDKYFDAVFTDEERGELRKKLMDACGYGVRRDGIRNYMGFEYDIERPAEDEIWPAFCSFGFTYKKNSDKLHDYALIHVCRQLQIDYKPFAKNEPKLSIDGFIACAKQAFPEFRSPRNKVELAIQEHKLHQLWCDWQEEECARTKCGKDGHWLCSDTFAERDYGAILDEIATYNEKRRKLRKVMTSAGAVRLKSAEPKKIAKPEKRELRLIYSRD